MSSHINKNISMNTLIIFVFLLVLALLIIRVLMCLPGIRPKNRVTKHSLKVMVVLGSGGHTGEMMPIIDSMAQNRKKYGSFCFVAANSDYLSFKHQSIPVDATKKTIPRSRNVGQSFISSVYPTIKSFLVALKLISEKPDLLLVNGPGVCFPVVAAMFIGNVFGFTKCSIVFIESICRVNTLSLTGKLIYPVCDLFLVHWSQLVPLRKRAKKIEFISKIY